MQVMHVQSLFHGVQSNFVGSPDGLTATNTPARHPHCKPVWIVVPSVTFFAHRCSTELATPNDERGVKQSALLQIGEKTSDGTV